MQTPFEKTVEGLKNRLIDEWQHAWKLWSVQLNAAGLVLLSGAEFAREGIAYVPPNLVYLVPHAQTLATAFFVLGLVARFIRQKKKGA